VSGAVLDAGLLERGAAAMGLALTPSQRDQLLQLGSELIRWNATYNLTAADSPREVLVQHLLDSLSVHADVCGERVADVGTGGGFPGLPLAIVQPQRQFLLIDSAGKKLRFIGHMVRRLGLRNVRTLHARVEALEPQPQDCVVTRAFAPLPRLLEWIEPLCDANTCVLAMKGQWPPAPGAPDAGDWPQGWHLDAVRALQVPGLDARRHLLRLSRRPAT
jgi:16S rRNA (guanine527-N7)-methyltransferase